LVAGSAFAFAVANVYGVTRRRFRRGDRPQGTGDRAIKAGGFLLEDLPRAVGRPVVDDDDFVWDAAEIQLKMQVLDGGCDAPFLVACGDDDRQES
jgi:hypothetical protein